MYSAFSSANLAASALPESHSARPRLPQAQRQALIVAAVLALHVLALWALQSGLLRRVAEVVVPVQILSDFIEPPQPKVVPPPPPPPVPAVKQPVVRPKEALPPPPMPVAVATPEPSPNAPTGVSTPQPPAPPITAPVAAAPAPAMPPAPPAPAKVVLPSTDADYLQNPKPAYPPMSKRLNEQGKVQVRVLIGEDGKPQKAELRQSSGYDRLDNEALKTVMLWRYVPGKRGGVPEAMWFVVPINFVLE